MGFVGNVLCVLLRPVESNTITTESIAVAIAQVWVVRWQNYAATSTKKYKSNTCNVNDFSQLLQLLIASRQIWAYNIMVIAVIYVKLISHSFHYHSKRYPWLYQKLLCFESILIAVVSVLTKEASILSVQASIADAMKSQFKLQLCLFSTQ